MIIFQQPWAVIQQNDTARSSQIMNKLSSSYSKTNYMHQFLKFILIWNNALHVSDGLSVHHHEFKTVHTATGICQTVTATCLLASLASRQQYLFAIYLLLYVALDAQVYQIYFGITLHMFRAVFLSIIGSLRLYIQQQVYGKQILLPACQQSQQAGSNICLPYTCCCMQHQIHKFIKFILE